MRKYYISKSKHDTTRLLYIMDDNKIQMWKYDGPKFDQTSIEEINDNLMGKLRYLWGRDDVETTVVTKDDFMLEFI